MSTINIDIALTPEQAAYVRRKAERDFGNVSEFFRDVLRARMSGEIAADLNFLKTTEKEPKRDRAKQKLSKFFLCNAMCGRN